MGDDLYWYTAIDWPIRFNRLRMRLLIDEEKRGKPLFCGFALWFAIDFYGGPQKWWVSSAIFNDQDCHQSLILSRFNS